MKTPIPNEATFYQDLNVVVTQSRYIANAKTYAMRNIFSVHISEIIKSRKLPIAIIIFGILMLLSSEVRIAGIFILAFAVLILFLIKDEFAVRISTNAGEVNTVVSKDKIRIQNIVNALNEAIIHRG